ncbi:hypothetical protein L484_011410 [Morus notabilis]|uniref:Uncharacterized protein n=1 Tax=Morus notabilis TaxID=981085 RepID=W9S0I5_9ROSA|nr:hypothetical protein L484_011410 [Morus notabilis]
MDSLAPAVKVFTASSFFYLLLFLRSSLLYRKRLPKIDFSFPILQVVPEDQARKTVFFFNFDLPIFRMSLCCTPLLQGSLTFYL